MDSVRAFLAIWLPEALRGRLLELASLLPSEPRDQISWVRPESLHLTLHFFGRVSQDDLSAVCLACREVAGRHSPFVLQLGNLGAFPARGAPNVMWVGVRPSSDLLALQFELLAKCGQYGTHKPGDKPFRPHITLCRVKSLSEVAGGRWRAAPPLEGDFAVTSFDLVQSETRPSGAEYTPLESFNLCLRT